MPACQLEPASAAAACSERQIEHTSPVLHLLERHVVVVFSVVSVVLPLLSKLVPGGTDHCVPAAPLAIIAATSASLRRHTSRSTRTVSAPYFGAGQSGAGPRWDRGRTLRRVSKSHWPAQRVVDAPLEAEGTARSGSGSGLLLLLLLAAVDGAAEHRHLYYHRRRRCKCSCCCRWWWWGGDSLSDTTTPLL